MARRPGYLTCRPSEPCESHLPSVYVGDGPPSSNRTSVHARRPGTPGGPGSTTPDRVPRRETAQSRLSPVSAHRLGRGPTRPPHLRRDSPERPLDTGNRHTGLKGGDCVPSPSGTFVNTLSESTGGPRSTPVLRGLVGPLSSSRRGGPVPAAPPRLSSPPRGSSGLGGTTGRRAKVPPTDSTVAPRTPLPRPGSGGPQRNTLGVEVRPQTSTGPRGWRDPHPQDTSRWSGVSTVQE